MIDDDSPVPQVGADLRSPLTHGPTPASGADGSDMALQLGFRPPEACADGVKANLALLDEHWAALRACNDLLGRD